jgi:hypothetical protein
LLIPPQTVYRNAETFISANGKAMPMPDQTPAFIAFLAPFALLWLSFVAVETRRTLAAVRTKGGRNV